MITLSANLAIEILPSTARWIWQLGFAVIVKGKGALLHQIRIAPALKPEFHLPRQFANVFLHLSRHLLKTGFIELTTAWTIPSYQTKYPRSTHPTDRYKQCHTCAAIRNLPNPDIKHVSEISKIGDVMQTQQFKEYDTQSGAATSRRSREADSYYNDMAKGVQEFSLQATILFMMRNWLGSSSYEKFPRRPYLICLKSVGYCSCKKHFLPG
jgi:hypothetical protein